MAPGTQPAYRRGEELSVRARAEATQQTAEAVSKTILSIYR